MRPYATAVSSLSMLPRQMEIYLRQEGRAHYAEHYVELRHGSKRADLA